MNKWLQEEASKTFSSLQLIEYKELEKGYYYDFSTNNLRFCLLLLDQKTPRTTWILHRELEPGEKEHWEHKYELKTEQEHNGYLKHINQLNVGEVLNKEAIKLVMTRPTDTIRKLKNDLKWIVFMGRGEAQ